ncbi:MAG: lactate racemase domain-containing protein [Candidatus Eisenbacteria bacterium]
MSFRGSVRRALAAPQGASLTQRFPAPLVTVLVGDAALGSHDEMALAEVAEALSRVGVPRGRMMTLLSGTLPIDAARRGRAREMHDMLGMPVVLHDPGEGPSFTVGTTPGGLLVQLDDELREAEGVVLVGEFANDPVRGAHGGPFALLPGLASAETLSRLVALQRDCGPGSGHEVLLEAARAMLALVKVDLAVVWDESDPPTVQAGGGDMLAILLEQGWGDRKR